MNFFTLYEFCDCGPQAYGWRLQKEPKGRARDHGMAYPFISFD